MNDQKIIENVGLALQYAGFFSRTKPYLRAEMQSEALYVLTVAVREHADHPNIEGYLRIRLRGAMLNLLKAEQVLIEYEDISGKTDNYFDLFLDDLFSTGRYTEEEEKIIRKRVEGYTDEEIGKALGLGQTAVNDRRIKIRHKMESDNEFAGSKTRLHERGAGCCGSSGRDQAGPPSHWPAGSVDCGVTTESEGATG